MDSHFHGNDEAGESAYSSNLSINKIPDKLVLSLSPWMECMQEMQERFLVDWVKISGMTRGDSEMLTLQILYTFFCELRVSVANN